MADDANDKTSKDEIAKGMADSGKGSAPTPRGTGKTGSGPADEVAEGMAESGSGTPTGGEGGSASGGGNGGSR